MSSANFARTATKFVLATACGFIAIFAAVFYTYPGEQATGIALAIASALGYLVVLLYKRRDDNRVARPGDRVVIAIAALATSFVAAGGVCFLLIGKIGLGLTVFAFSAAAFFGSARIGQGYNDAPEVWSAEELEAFYSYPFDDDDMTRGLNGIVVNIYTELLPGVDHESMFDRY